MTERPERIANLCCDHVACHWQVKYLLEKRDVEWQDIMHKAAQLHRDSVELAKSIARRDALNEAAALLDRRARGGTAYHAAAREVRAIPLGEIPEAVEDNGLAGVPCVAHGKDCDGSTSDCEPEKLCTCGKPLSLHYDSRDENRPANAVLSHPGTPADTPEPHTLIIPEGYPRTSERPSCSCGEKMPKETRFVTGWHVAHLMWGERDDNA